MSGGPSEQHAAPAIRVRGLSVAFDDRVILENLDLDVERGEVLGIVGGSGSGKSVLLNTILGLKAPSTGTIELLGETVEDKKERASLDCRIGVMFQNGALFSSLTVQENVEAPLLEHSSIRGEWLSRVALMKISLVGLASDAAVKKPAELSGGMRKRAAVARALALDPELLFLDEPTSGLDPQATIELLEIIRNLKHKNVTVLLSSHLLDRVQSVCDRVALFSQGHIVLIGSVDELGRKVLGGTFNLDVEAEGSGLDAKLRAIPGVTGVETLGPNRWRLKTDRDVRSETAGVVMGAGGKLLRLSVETPTLETIYTRYFRDEQEGRHAA